MRGVYEVFVRARSICALFARKAKCRDCYGWARCGQDLSSPGREVGSLATQRDRRVGPVSRGDRFLQRSPATCAYSPIKKIPGDTKSVEQPLLDHPACLVCGGDPPLPKAVQPGRRHRYCGYPCRRRAEMMRRKSARWRRLSEQWRAKGITDAAARCLAIAERIERDTLKVIR